MKVKRATAIGFVFALLSSLLVFAAPANADVSGTWTNTGALAGTDCPATWSGASTYTLQSTSILKVTVAGTANTACSITLRGADLSTWQVSLDSGASWTTLAGTYEGFPLNATSFEVWYRVGTTSAVLGSGEYATVYGSQFQAPIVSITPIVDKGSAEFTFWLPDGRECTSISPVSVPIDSQYTLPEPGADCRTTSGAQIVGWKVGWDDLVHPPGHPVLVIDSQRFTAVLKEEVLAVEFDANVGSPDECFAGKTNVPVQHRTITQEVDRDDLANYRIMLDPVCTPAGHYFTGWNTRPAGTELKIGSPAPDAWSTTTANTVRLFAQWKPQPIRLIDILNPADIELLTPAHVMVGYATPAPGAVENGAVVLTSANDVSVFTQISPVMTQAVKDFFLNGGQSLSIVPAAGSDAASLTAAIDAIDVPAALDLAVPELRGLSVDDWVDVAGALVTQADSLWAMAWIDPPAAAVSISSTDKAQAVDNVISAAERLRAVVGSASPNGSLLGSGVVDASGAARAASPGVLGVRSRTDENFGIWVPMGAFDGIVAVTSELDPTPAQRGQLQVGAISPVIDFPSGQTIVAPTITLDRDVRTTSKRFEDWVFQSLKDGLAQYGKYPNEKATWASMTSEIATVMTQLYNEGALFGNAPIDAFRVDCSANSQQIAAGTVRCEIEMAITMPGEFDQFILDVPVKAGQPSDDDAGPIAPAPVFPNPNSDNRYPQVYTG